MILGNCRCDNVLRSLLLCLSLPLLAASVGCGVSSSASTGPSTKIMTAIAASPATANLAIGANEQFKATATYSDSSTADVTAAATWTDANAKVATITPSGDATAVGAGSTTVTATMDGLTGSATLTVAAPAKTLTSIAISPGTASILAGATQQFTATATYSDSSTANVTATVSWTTSNAAVAKVNSAGLATALAAGSATITATLSGVSGSAALSVPAPPPPQVTLVSIAVSPGTISIAAKTTQQFTATGKYSDGSTADVTRTASWVSSNTGVATVNASGLTTAVAAGSATITASLSGVAGTATLTVTPILSSISVSPNAPSIAVGATQQFTATGTYSDGSKKPVTTATWTAANPAIATVNASGLATAVASGSTQITASSNGISGSTTLTVSGLTLSISPNPATFAMGATQQFTATATQSGGSPNDVTASAQWSIANTAVATVASGGLTTGVAAGSTTITASYNGITANAPITVTVNAGVNIPTWHVDNNRSGLNASEKSLTPANVAPKTFGKLFSYLVDGYAYAEPLLMSNVTIKGAVHNVLYVATEYDSVYAFDADTYGTGAPLWKTSLLQSGETPITGATVLPYQGVTSTPVIDQSSNTIYVVSAQKSSANGASYRLNALDITTGLPKQAAVTITASVSGTNSTASGGKVSLPAGCVQRAALLLANGTIYIGVGSCHSGWLLSYNEQTLQQTGVFNASPNIDGEGTYGGAGGVWMGSGGPVADSAGNIYISTGNGPYDTTQGSYGDSILKFSPTLTLLDHFTPMDYEFMNCNDSDLAAGGLLMIPASGQIVGGGKMGKLYLVNTSNLGGEQSNDAGAVDTLYVEQGIDNSQPYPTSCTDASGTHNVSGVNSYEIFGTSAYFNGSIYLGVTPTSTTNAPGVVRRFTYTPGSTSATGTLAAEESTPLNLAQQQPENTRGTTPFVSANGPNDGILWTIDQGQPLQTPLGPQATTNATLYAYDATNLGNELYSSSANSGDVPGYGIKFTSPIVANAKVYISTGHDPVTASQPQGEIDVYGLK
jgi:uncharacterized protein YjdB